MKYCIHLFFLLVFSNQVFAGEPKLGVQRYSLPLKHLESSESVMDRLRFGGNIGLQFGNPTTVLVSPSVGYVLPADWLDDRLMLGVGITYIYSSVKYSDPSGSATIKYVSNIYGGRVFARGLITENIFGYTEYEFLNAPNYYVEGLTREWVNSFFVGGGYLMPFSDRGGLSITVLYNLAWTPLNIIYSSPWNIRFGVMF